MAISALQKSQGMYEEEEMRQKAKQQAKYGAGSDMHKLKFETFKQMQRKQTSCGYKDLLTMSRMHTNNPNALYKTNAGRSEQE